MRKRTTPNPRRRKLLKLMATSVAGAGLSGLRAPFGGAAEARARAADSVIALEFDSTLRSRIVAQQGSVALTDFEASETARVESKDINEFAFLDTRHEAVQDRHGPGTRHVLRGANASVEKRVSVALYDRYPGFAIIRVTYRNVGRQRINLQGWTNAAHVLKPTAEGALEYWSFSGGSYVDRRDWVQPLHDGFSQRNFMGMNATDYGGGTPVVDVWRRDYGLAAGHVEAAPKLVALPIMVTPAGARIAVEFNQTRTLGPGEELATFETFVAVHRGDYFATLETYRRLMGERGLVQAKVPSSAYEPVWCGWGYEKDFTVDQLLGTLPKASELGLVWAVPDDGWQTALGDWYLNPKKFPRGDADMIALVKAIKDAGMKPRLWVAPLAAQPGTDLLRNHSDLLLLDKSGAPQDVTGWNSLYLCPAYSQTVDRTRALMRKMVGEWGFEGLKIDGQHLNAVAPCHNPAHRHVRPEESVEKLQDFYKAIYDEIASINPDVLVEICPCGTSYAFHNMPYMHQAVGSDPLSSWQVRHKGKTIKALMGPSAPYAGDHVELSDNGNDFASTVGIGAVVSTKFTWPRDAKEKNHFVLTDQKEALWRKWIALYKEKGLAQGLYIGNLYDIGFDKPEAHVVAKDSRLYYAFYADRWDGLVELRGLDNRRYTLTNYWTGSTMGTASPTENRLHVAFERFALIEAAPVSGS